MKDLLKAVIPVTIAVLAYMFLAERGEMEQPNWLIAILLIVTISLVVYVVLRLFQRKKFPKP